MSSDLAKAALDRGHHPLVCELFQTLPPLDQSWTAPARARWLKAAEGIFDLVYEGKKQEKRETVPAVATLAPVTEAAPPEPVAPDHIVPWSEIEQKIIDILPQLIADNPSGTTVLRVQEITGATLSEAAAAVSSLGRRGLVQVSYRLNSENTLFTAIGQKKINDIISAPRKTVEKPRIAGDIELEEQIVRELPGHMEKWPKGVNYDWIAKHYKLRRSKAESIINTAADKKLLRVERWPDSSSYVILPNGYDRGPIPLTASQQNVYDAMNRLAVDGIVTAGVRGVCKEAGMSLGGINATLYSLERKKLIEKVEPGSPNQPSTYRVLPHVSPSTGVTG